MLDFPGKNKQVKVAIIGGGVSGVAAALTFSKSIQVDIYEREDRLLKKLLKTGNGKANIFNLNVSQTSFNNPDFIAQHPDLVKVTRDFYRDLGLLTFIDEEGRGYPFSRSAKALAHHLVERLGSHTKVFLSTNIKEIKFQGSQMMVNDRVYDYLVITTGSSAYNPMVDLANNNGPILSSLNLKVNSFYPTSGPLMVKENLRLIENERVQGTLNLWKDHQLVATEKGEILFKKDSLSGIASFIMSSYLIWDYRTSHLTDYQLSLNLIEGVETEVEALLGTRPIDHQIFAGLFSDSLNTYLVSRLPKKAKLAQVMHLLTHLTFNISPDFILSQERGQLMSGGVDVNEINAHTFALNRFPNLYLGGEVIDIDGISGGYNLMFALYSGVQIAHSIMNK